MSWLMDLYETYENNRSLIGEFELNKYDQEFSLIPLSHTTQSAQIEVIVDIEGNFVTAKVVDKSDASTIIPCTEASANRTSAPVPHPLCDKLVYVAGDYIKYGGVQKKGNPHADYMTQLKEWCDSEYAHPKVIAVYEYLKKGRLIEDLIEEKIIHVNEDEKFIEKWDKETAKKYGEKPSIFKVIADKQSDAFVRFAVTDIGDPEARLWRDKSVHESFIRFNNKTLQKQDYCYITGEYKPITEKHASRIRFSSDMAKLISANDTSGFTYRGRFKESNDAVSISYEVSQKAHNALKWLIAKQGYSIDGKVFLVWGKDKPNIPLPFEDTLGLYSDSETILLGDVTHEEFANQVKKAINGYKHDLKYDSKVIIMILDAATPGRMSILYYRNINAEDFFNHLENWHKTCYWLHGYQKDEDKREILFKGAPATKDIAFATYGPNANEKVVKNLLERMLPSIIDGRKIPIDIIRSAFNRASNPQGMEESEWKKTLSITCALINKKYEKEGLDVALNENFNNRDYLFGRMLAIADVLERRALGREEKRATNAIRYMNAFAQHPLRTWNIIQSSIQPYQAKLGDELWYLNQLLDEVGSKMDPDKFNDEPLTGLYLLGFYSQRHELNKGRKEKDEERENRK